MASPYIDVFEPDILSNNGDGVRIPTSPHRHAVPSAPWPWVDTSDGPGGLLSSPPPVPELCDHVCCDGECWRGYPESCFPTWARDQVRKSKILKAIEDYNSDEGCRLYHVDVGNDGVFTTPTETIITEDSIQLAWEYFVENNHRPNLRVRVMFIENLSGPVLQMLGTKYVFNVQPLFWSSSLNWLPSRYQEDARPGEGDHIMICLTFLRSIRKEPKDYDLDASDQSVHSTRPATSETTIDTQGPLHLSSSGHVLVQDLLSVYLIRSTEDSTIISYHPNLPLPTTTARELHQRIRAVGWNTYWQKIFCTSSDPTFVLLTFFWHAIYAWDEALEDLGSHITWLEENIVDQNEMKMTTEVHVIRAHQLRFSPLLDDFRKAVKFIMNTPNPAIESRDISEREQTGAMLSRECESLLDEIKRLSTSWTIYDKRVENAMNLMVNSRNILDSKRFQKMSKGESPGTYPVSIAVL
ncbi:hypothetical protein P691DRAFT_676454 [Macrolepiota fuliginosa MF-IS2]|uniref:Uncharacterized protein n=1 Tax=Macrolepiota fuliginosa MF-IS2 TaxID=1400762 RepID=A0A9P5X817_9AGAR|nr:hypothetical protein P691DRAFT_676454 [Macrolepiota fuliginosa MF-IS2]